MFCSGVANSLCVSLPVAVFSTVTRTQRGRWHFSNPTQSPYRVPPVIEDLDLGSSTPNARRHNYCCTYVVRANTRGRVWLCSEVIRKQLSKQNLLRKITVGTPRPPGGKPGLVGG